MADTYIRFPAPADVRHDRLGRLQIVIRTNLPEGTVAVIRVTEADTITTQRVFVVDGELSLTTPNRGCRLGYRQTTRPVAVHVVVGPKPNMMTMGLCGQGSGGCNSPQPVSVYRALGRRFERLHGAQVTETGGGNYISLSRAYVFSTAATCLSSTPVPPIRKLLPFFPRPGVGRTCCDTPEKTAVQYASAVLDWKTPTLESGGCFTGSPPSCPHGPATQTFFIHRRCLACREFAIRVDQVRIGSETWWGVTQVQLGHLAIDASAGDTIVAGSQVSVRTTLPAATRVAVGWWYLDACGQAMGLRRVVTVSGSVIRFPAATFGWAPACGGVAHRTNGPLAGPTDGFLMAERLGTASPTDISFVAVRFVPA